jgi:hypothetical protein
MVNAVFWVFIDQVAAVNWQPIHEHLRFPLESGRFAQAGMPALLWVAVTVVTLVAVVMGKWVSGGKLGRGRTASRGRGLTQGLSLRGYGGWPYGGGVGGARGHWVFF